MNNNRYLLMSGSLPPDACGVGDYTQLLYDASDKKRWRIFKASDWSIIKFFSTAKKILSKSPTHIIIQYPTMGYGWSLLPQLLAIYFHCFTKIKVVTVLHEFSKRTAKAKIATLLFNISDNLIFTSDFEKKEWTHFTKRRNKCHTIPIISNIPISSHCHRSIKNRKIDLVYFGLIMPNKGLEDFLSVAKKLKNKRKNINIIGKIAEGHNSYGEYIIKETKKIGINLLNNLNSNEVADCLAESKVCFLPFPDGVSERRGSFLAALQNGCLITTYEGMYTTDAIKQVVFITDHQNSEKTILNLLSYDEASCLEKMEKAKKYLSQIPSNWNKIIELYETTLTEEQ